MTRFVPNFYEFSSWAHRPAILGGGQFSEIGKQGNRYSGMGNFCLMITYMKLVQYMQKYNSENKAKSLKRVSRMRESNYWSLTVNALGMAGLFIFTVHTPSDSCSHNLHLTLIIPMFDPKIATLSETNSKHPNILPIFRN